MGLKRSFLAIFLLGSALLVLTLLGLYFTKPGSENPGTELNVTLFTSPTCGCCHNYASYLEDRGAEVEIVYLSSEELAEKMSIAPEDMRSCHIVEVEGYYVVGHVPVEIIQKLLAEQPNVDGISLPGMPPGSPGMGGVKEGAFTVYYFDAGRAGVYAIG